LKAFIVSELAVVDGLPGGLTKIGGQTHVWPFASIGAGAVIGEDCTIGQCAHIGPHVRIGNGCKIQNGAQLFDGVELHDAVFIGPHVVFTNVLNPRAGVSRRHEFKHTVVGKGASIGANSTILCGVTIGHHALIGAGSVVTKDVQPHAIMVGNPARASGRWACVCGEALHHLQCPRCNAKYRCGPDGVKLEER